MMLLPIVVFALILVSAGLAASETAIFTMARAEQIRHRLTQPVQLALERLMRRPLESLIVAIGLNEGSNVFATCLATAFFLFWLGGEIGPYVAAPVMFVVVLICCDITPKTFALGHPTGVIRLTARPLAVLTELAHPVARYFAPGDVA